MNYSLVELDLFTGDKATIYSLLEDRNEGVTLFDKFLMENKDIHKEEVKDIIKTLTIIGRRTGAREQFFKLHEGNPGDGVVALYDNPNSNLRLYCIKYGVGLIILGGGGVKPKEIRALQENDKLTQENEILRKVSSCIIKKFKDKDLCIAQDDYGDYFDGDLDININ